MRLINKFNFVAAVLAPVFVWTAAAQAAGEPSNLDKLKTLLEQFKSDKIPQIVRDKLPGPREWTFWGHFNTATLDDDRPGNAKESDIWTWSGGVDWHPAGEAYTLGVSFLRQKTDTTSEPSPAPVQGFSEIETEGVGFALSGAYSFNHAIAADAMFSYMDTETTTTDRSLLAAPAIKRSDGRSYSFGAGVRVAQPVLPQLGFEGRLGYTHSFGAEDSSFDSFGRFNERQTFETGVLGLNTSLHYGLFSFLAPFVGLDLAYDVVSKVSNPALVSNGPGLAPATVVPFQDGRERFSYGYQVGANVIITPDVVLKLGYRAQHWGSDLTYKNFNVTLNLRL